MGADISEAEEASDEVMAAIAAGGTYSFVPEPDEDESVLPGEDLADLLGGEDTASVALAVDVEEETEGEAGKPARSRTRKAIGRSTVVSEDQDGTEAEAGAAEPASTVDVSADAAEDSAPASEAAPETEDAAQTAATN
jgi:hypothetical protein